MNHRTKSTDFDYVYDNIGNRTNIAKNAINDYYWLNSLNQYEWTAADEFLPPWYQYTYDTDGNLVGKTGYLDENWTPVDIYANTWNAENRLIEHTPANPVLNDKKAQFSYDYMGRRYQKIVSTYNGTSWDATQTNTFIYDNWNLIAEISVLPSSITTNYYVWGLDLSGSLQGAGGVGGLLCVVQGRASSPSEPYYPCYDANGNIVQMINDAGTTVASYEYDAFGNITSQSGSMASENKFRFSTKYFDDETGLSYYGYRYYDAGLGRWLSRDPIGERGFYTSSVSWLKEETPLGISRKPCGGCKCKSVASNHQADVFEARSIEEWRAMKSIETLMHNPSIKPLYLFVYNNPESKIDYLGLDSPGCDGVPGAVETACILECCAAHDKCYKDNSCKASSWINPCASKACKKCNSDAVSCITGCGPSNKDDPNKPNYYCAKCGVYFDDPNSVHMQHSTN